MEYYAKSQKKILDVQKQQKIAEEFQTEKEQLKRYLVPSEMAAFERAMDNALHNTSEPPKTLKEHHEDTKKCAENFFKIYGRYFEENMEHLVAYTCENHDIGKTNSIMQSVLGNPDVDPELKKSPQIPHGYLSALSITKKMFHEENKSWTVTDYRVLLTAIYYHHKREDTFSLKELEDFAKQYYLPYLNDFGGDWKFKAENLNELLFRRKGAEENALPPKEDEWLKYAVCKGLLNKFDWCASAGDIEAEIRPDLQKKALKKEVERRFSSFRPVQEFMREHPEDNLIIAAPTGSGKTEAALLWLNGEKGFYTLPLKVSSNAIYHRIKDTYGFKDAALLHSDSMMEYLKDNWDTEQGGYGYYEKAKRFSYPLTVCTVDQLFKFVFKSLGTEIFAATLSYSKVIIDEIQAYSPEIIASLIYGLYLIKKMGGRYAIITATFPPVLKYFMDKYGLGKGQGAYLLRDFTVDSDLYRHKAEIRESDFDAEELLEKAENNKVLVLCNTISRAQKLYSDLKETGIDTEIFLLHSRYIRKHRMQLEEKILDCSQDSSWNGICISTQITEASLDIDFDILYTEMSPCESLLQRMGRCNRKGRYIPGAPNIIVHALRQKGKNGIYDAELLERSLKFLRLYEGVIFTEAMKSEYIQKVYDPKEIKGTKYYKKIERNLSHLETIHPEDYTKEEADQEFRKIDSITVMPDKIYRENRDMVLGSLHFLTAPYVGREAKALVRSKLNDLTLNINCYFGRYPDKIDKGIIYPDNGDTENYKYKTQMMEIHRSQYKYDFDEINCCGSGLLLDSVEEEEFFL